MVLSWIIIRSVHCIFPPHEYEQGERTMQVVFTSQEDGIIVSEEEQQRIWRKFFKEMKCPMKRAYVIYASKTHYYFVTITLDDNYEDLLRLTDKQIMMRGKSIPINFTLKEEIEANEEKDIQTTEIK